MILSIFSNLGSLLLFIVIICFVIGWHELGHLITAKKCNVYCYEYSIGMGPAIYKTHKGETQFVIRALPLGGFVRMAGEEGLDDGEILTGNNGEPIPKDRILGNQSCGKRALVLAAGGLMNMLLAVFCFYFFVSFNKVDPANNVTGFIETIHSNEVRIVEESLLANAGVDTGDRVVSIKTRIVKDGVASNEYDTYNTKNFKKINNALNKNVPQSLNEVQEIIISYEDISENNTLKEVSVTRKMEEVLDKDGKPVYDDKGNKSYTLSKIGLGQSYKIHEYNALTGLYGAWHFMGYYTTEIVRALGEVFQGHFENLSGIVGIYSTVDNVATDTSVPLSARILNVVYLTGAISFSLGFFNLIPFPALDGGRLVFVGLEAIRNKKINPKTEAMIHTVGIILLFVLMIVINIRDILNLF